MEKITDFDLAIDIVKRYLGGVRDDMRVHGADDTYEAIANVLMDVLDEMCLTSDAIYGIGA
jgi:hypothetical protein